MKKMKNIISILLLAIAVCAIGIYAYAAEINITQPEEYHKYIVLSINENDVTYICDDCAETVNIPKSEITVMWNIDYVNKQPQQTDVDDSSYLDLNNDNVINAKDFAILNKF
jgi:hypothetical protein